MGAGLQLMEPSPGGPHVRWMEADCFLEGDKGSRVTGPCHLIGEAGHTEGNWQVPSPPQLQISPLTSGAPGPQAPSH